MATHNSTWESVTRNVALCYINQSAFLSVNQIASLEYQRDNIDAVCRCHGWIPEFYFESAEDDADSRANPRTAWLRLNERLTSPDVTALILNDFSVVAQRIPNVLNLLDGTLAENSVHFVLADPNLAQLDTSQPSGKLILFAFMWVTEAYARMTDQQRRMANLQPQAKL